MFYTVQKCVEFGELCKNKCKNYRKVVIAPIVSRHMHRIYVNRR